MRACQPVQNHCMKTRAKTNPQLSFPAHADRETGDLNHALAWRAISQNNIVILVTTFPIPGTRRARCHPTTGRPYWTVPAAATSLPWESFCKLTGPTYE